MSSANSLDKSSPVPPADAPEVPCTTTGVHSLIGTRIDEKYQVLERLGSGGMGAVYKAEHVMMGRKVALKVLHPHLIENEELMKRFQHEARIASRLDHPNAVETYDFGVWRGAPYLVMEFVEGRTLRERISAEGLLPRADVKTIFVQVCSALTKAHQLGIIHRDLKPDNIMLTTESDGSITTRVLDFGIAKVLDEKIADPEDIVKTQVGTFFGTPKYASPEQLLRKPLDGRSDIYTLGIILYEVLSGQIPFDAPSVMEVILKQLNETPTPLRQFKPELDIPDGFETLVSRCLSKEPVARFQSMTELGDALAAVQLEAPQRSRRSWFYGGAAAVAFMIGGVWLLPNGASRSSRPQPIPSQQLSTLAHVDQIELPPADPPSAAISSGEKPPQADESSSSNPLLRLALHGVMAAIGRSDETPVEVASEMPRLDEPVAPPGGEAQPESPPPLVIENPQVDVAPLVLRDGPNPLLQQDAQTGTAGIITAPGTTAAVTEALRRDLAIVEDGKKQAAVLYNSGRDLMRKKRYAEAAAKFEQAIQLRSDAVGSYISLGNCYLRLGQLDRSKKAFFSAIQADPSYGPAHYNLAAFYAVNGDQTSALSSLERAVRLDPAARAMAANEPDFTGLRSNPSFRRLTGR